MPRQDVPYGGAICRLKERIAEIWDKLGEKLHSVNGVTGDAAGNVEIVSGDAAITVSEDQVNHTIEIGMDRGELPSAAVSNANGQTGALVLDANDIDAGLTPPGTSVAQDLASTKQQIQVVGGLVQQEILDRQNADSTLQTNINTLSASLPAAAAAAVAADPSVAQLVTDMAGKVDLTDVSTVETPDTIAKRNGNGRLVAADPASGATDKTLTTANWISQTGSGRPNNLIHDTGNESIDGVKPMLKGAHSGLHESGSGNQNGWRKIFISPSFATLNENNIASFILTTNAGAYGVFMIIGRNNNLTDLKRISGNYPAANVKASIDSSNEVIIWAYNYRTVALLETESHVGSFKITFQDSGIISVFNEPVVPDYVQVITGV